LVSVVKFIPERGPSFRDMAFQRTGVQSLEMMKTLDRPEIFFKQNFKKRKYYASGDWFCNSFTKR